MPTERDIESLESWQVARIIIHFIVFFLSNASIYNGAEILSNSILLTCVCILMLVLCCPVCCNLYSVLKLRVERILKIKLSILMYKSLVNC